VLAITMASKAEHIKMMPLADSLLKKLNRNDCCVAAMSVLIFNREYARKY